MRNLSLLFALAATFFFAATARMAEAAGNTDTTQTAHLPGEVGLDVADFQARLETGLKARLPREFEFIDRIVELVKDGKLPQKLVDRIYFWARRQNDHIPFPYFERALVRAAAAIGVRI